MFPIVIVVSSKLPVNTLSELVSYAKERPDQINYGSVGIGSSQHLSGAYFEQVAGLKLTHVPYRNIAQYAPDLMAGTVPLGFQWLPNVLAPLGAGGAKAIAVATDKRMKALPDVQVEQLDLPFILGGQYRAGRVDEFASGPQQARIVI